VHDKRGSQQRGPGAGSGHIWTSKPNLQTSRPSSPSPPSVRQPSPLVDAEPPLQAFVTTARDSSTSGMLVVGTMPSSLGAFGRAISGPVRAWVVSSPPRRRRRALPSSAPRRSVRLAKKSLPAVVAAQNVLLKNLGFLESQKIMAGSINDYIEMFKNGLSEEQAHLISELFTE
jgi:hypothetical protein